MKESVGLELCPSNKYENQRLLELKRHMREAIEGQEYSHTSSSTKNNHNFLQLHCSYSCHKSSRATEMGSQRGYCKGVRMGQALEIYNACWPRPQPCGPRPHHPYQQIKAIISCHCRCFPRIRDISILYRSMLEIFEDINCNISDLRILHVQMTRFFSHALVMFILVQCSEGQDNL